MNIRSILIFFFLLGFALNVSGTDKIDFHRSLTHALKKSVKEDKYIFAYMYTAWSAPCRQMTEETFRDSLLISELNKEYINLSINATTNKKIAKEYSVRIFPSLLVIDKSGNTIVRTSGFKTPQEVRQLISRTKSHSRFLKQNIDSLANVLTNENILQAIDSVRLYRDEYTSKNLAKRYLDKHKKEWSNRVCMRLLNDHFTMDKKYLKFVSKNHRAFFMVFDSISLKENIAFHVFLKSLKSGPRGRPKFNLRPMEKWFKRYKILDYDKMADFVKIKYLLWGRGPSIRSSINLIENYPETSNESVLYSSVIRILLSDNSYRKPIDFHLLIDKIESALEEGSYWRYDVLSLLYYKLGNLEKTNECITIAQDIANVLNEEYSPILDALKYDIDKSNND